MILKGCFDLTANDPPKKSKVKCLQVIVGFWYAPIFLVTYISFERVFWLDIHMIHQKGQE